MHLTMPALALSVRPLYVEARVIHWRIPEYRQKGGGDYMAENSEQIEHAARVIHENRTGVVLTGRIVDGRVELDESTMDRIRDGFPGADVAFIAVNAPFDAKSQSI